MKWHVTKELEGQRLREALQWLAEGTVSKSKIRKLCTQQQVCLNGIIVSSDARVKEGDCIWLNGIESNRPRYSAEFKVLFEDDDMLAIEKPSGWVTSGNLFRSVENALPLNMGKGVHVLPRPQPVHRLDASTSGVLLCAKTKPALRHLYACFAQQKMTKVYLAIVRGFMASSGIVSHPLDGKQAMTSWKTIARFPSIRFGYISRLRISIATGRTHQIRRHMRIIGHPVLGDSIYDSANLYPGKGLFLHATSLKFSQLDGNDLLIHSSTPFKFETFCDREQKQWRRSMEKKL